mgnify:CR=1 FL=1
MKILKVLIPIIVIIISYFLIRNEILQVWAALFGCISVVILGIQFAQKYIFPPKNKRK